MGTEVAAGHAPPIIANPPPSGRDGRAWHRPRSNETSCRCEVLTSAQMTSCRQRPAPNRRIDAIVGQYSPERAAIAARYLMLDFCAPCSPRRVSAISKPSPRPDAIHVRRPRADDPALSPDPNPTVGFSLRRETAFRLRARRTGCAHKSYAKRLDYRTGVGAARVGATGGGGWRGYSALIAFNRASKSLAGLREARPIADSLRQGQNRHPARVRRGAFRPFAATRWRGCGTRRHSSSRAFHLPEWRFPCVLRPWTNKGCAARQRTTSAWRRW